MNILKDKRYIIRLLINGKMLTYNCLVTAVDEDSISFTDINENNFTYKKEFVVGYQEI